MSASCYLCVERPPPGDLRSHLLYHHLIENDEALPSIISLSRKENIETQTTVTWVNEFEYFDNRKKTNNYTNGHFEEQEIQKSLVEAHIKSSSELLELVKKLSENKNPDQNSS